MRPEMHDRMALSRRDRRIPRISVYAWIAKEGLPGHRIGRLWKFKGSEVDEWVHNGKAADAQRDEESR